MLILKSCANGGSVEHLEIVDVQGQSTVFHYRDDKTRCGEVVPVLNGVTTWSCKGCELRITGGRLCFVLPANPSQMTLE